MWNIHVVVSSSERSALSSTVLTFICTGRQFANSIFTYLMQVCWRRSFMKESLYFSLYGKILPIYSRVFKIDILPIARSTSVIRVSHYSTCWFHSLVWVELERNKWFCHSARLMVNKCSPGASDIWWQVQSCQLTSLSESKCTPSLLIVSSWYLTVVMLTIEAWGCPR